MKGAFSSVKGLGWKLEVKAADLERLAVKAVHHYRPFVKARSGKRSRRIDNPDKELKFVQRRIEQRLLRALPMPDYMHGGVRGRSPKTNAAAHLGRRSVVRIDLESFFPSVTDQQVYALWKKLGYGPPLAALLTALTTYRGRLPQGAPTSMALANLVLMDADDEIRIQADAQSCSFSRYVDDIALSGDAPEFLMQPAIEIVRKSGFRVSRAKIDIMNNSGLQELTGLSTNSGRPSVPRYKRDEVRAAIHQLQTTASSEWAFRKAVDSIRGRIQYISLINPGSAAALTRQLQKALNLRESSTNSRPE